MKTIRVRYGAASETLVINLLVGNDGAPSIQQSVRFRGEQFSVRRGRIVKSLRNTGTHGHEGISSTPRSIARCHTTLHALSRTQARIMKLTDKNLRQMATLDGGSDTLSTNQQEDDNISIARTALSEGGRSVRSIHSTRSLAAVAEKARVGIITAREGGGGTAPASLEKGVGGAEENEAAVNDILVVTHQEDGGLRLGGKNTVSNLPYIRRNPAI